MEISYDKINYIKEDSFWHIDRKLSNGIHILSSIAFISESFVDYQKEIMIDFIADLSDKIWKENYLLDDVKDVFEKELYSLNDKLKAFAKKMDKVENFVIKWFAQIIVDNVLITSMIWDVSVMIFRNDRLYYSLHNDLDNKEKIDVFSDFVEWDIESHDNVIYIWTKINDVLDDVDIENLEKWLKDDSSMFLQSFENVLHSRVDVDKVSFLSHYEVKWRASKVSKKSAFSIKMPDMSGFSALKKYKKAIIDNKYYVSLWILSLLVLVLFYHVLNQIVSVQQTDIMFTDDGSIVDVTIDDIKQDIQVFLSMDPSSDVKWQKYHDIMQKLNVLEERGRWIEDVNQLKSIIQRNYFQWFNIIYINDLAMFDDNLGSARVLSFNNAERNALGDLMYIWYGSNIIVAWTQWVLLNVISSSVRGSLMDLWLSQPINGCGKNLLRNGLYCFTDDTIYNVTNAGVEILTTSDEEWFPSDIDGVDVYGRANMYVFHRNFAWAGTWSVFVRRYRNVLWSQTRYQEWVGNTVLYNSMPGWSSFDMWFSSYTIDGSFIWWSKSDKWLYQFWREWVSNALSVREIRLQWWDSIRSSYGDDVIVHASFGSRYVYLLDRENNNFTVYDSNPAKDADPFRRDYVLRYLFRFQFDLTGEEIIDFVVPEAGANRPELFLLTDNGVYKIRLHEFIDSLASGVLKEL